jgi:hypothetical protein
MFVELALVSIKINYYKYWKCFVYRQKSSFPQVRSMAGIIFLVM